MPIFNHDKCRNHVRENMTKAWGEPGFAIKVGKLGTVRYEVPGRRADGTYLGENNTVRILKTAVGILLIPVKLILMLPAMILDSEFELNLMPENAKVSVRGKEGSDATVVGDALVQAKRDLWLVWANSHIAFIKVRASSEHDVLWSRSGNERPSFKQKNTTFTWPDGSTLVLALATSEERRFRKFRGEQ